ncbi:MAG: ribbon-helix-helix protein, CopG family [Promethearchaeota archaeon]
MKIVTVNIPDSYLRLLEKSSLCTGIYRSELIRQAVRSYLIKEMKFAKRLEIEVEDKRITRFFEYCINCERKLHTIERRDHLFHKKVEVFQLRFCCSCYDKFKNTPFNKFPKQIIDKIKKKVKAYKNYRLRL